MFIDGTAFGANRFILPWRPWTNMSPSTKCFEHIFEKYDKGRLHGGRTLNHKSRTSDLTGKLKIITYKFIYWKMLLHNSIKFLCDYFTGLVCKQTSIRCAICQVAYFETWNLITKTLSFLSKTRKINKTKPELHSPEKWNAFILWRIIIETILYKTLHIFILVLR